MKKAILNSSQTLAIFAVACTALVSTVNWLTKDTIKQQEELQLLNTLHQVIDKDTINNDLHRDCSFIFDTELLGSNEQQTAYIGRYDDSARAVALTTVAPDGYNGKIKLLVAINLDGSLSGVRVLSHQETPGLGDKIETRKSDWIKSFAGKSFSSEDESRWAVKKDGGIFDQFTGATITPRAVVKAVKHALFYFEQNKQTLLTSTDSCRGSNDS